MNIKDILFEMKNTVESGKIMPPNWWCDKALQLTALWQDLKDELTKAEMAYIREINEVSEKFDYSDAKATKIVKGYVQKNGEMTAYQLYKYLEGRDKVIKEFIMLAKKRATIEEYGQG